MVSMVSAASGCVSCRRTSVFSPLADCPLSSPTAWFFILVPGAGCGIPLRGKPGTRWVKSQALPLTVWKMQAPYLTSWAPNFLIFGDADVYGLRLFENAVGSRPAPGAWEVGHLFLFY